VARRAERIRKESGPLTSNASVTDSHAGNRHQRSSNGEAVAGAASSVTAVEADSASPPESPQAFYARFTQRSDVREILGDLAR